METLRCHYFVRGLPRFFPLRGWSIFRPLFSLAVILTALFLIIPVGGAFAEVSIVVDAAQAQGYVNPLVFGQNVLFDGNTIWDQTQDAIKADADDSGVNLKSRISDLGPTVLRFPGGEASEVYLWEDGLGLPTREALNAWSSAMALTESPQFWNTGKGLLVEPGAGRIPLENLSGQLGDSFDFTGIDPVNQLLTGVANLNGAHAAGAAVRPGGRPLGGLGQLSEDYWTNSYGIIEHLKLSKCLAAQPLITVNFSTGLDAAGSISNQVSLDQKIMRAQALVAFCNGTADSTPLGIDGEGRDWRTVGYWAGKRWRGAQGQTVPPLGVKYWEVGNEPCFISDPGLTTAKDYAEKFDIFARKMKAIDPTIRVGAAGLNLPTWYGEAADDPDPWNETVIKGTKDDLDFLSIHSYYPAAVPATMDFTSDAWFKLVMAGATQAWKDLVEIRGIIDANVPAREVGLAVTEYGFLIPGGDARYYSNLARALYEADMLMYLLRGARQLGLVAAAAWNLHGANENAAIGYQWPETWTASGSRTIRPQYYAQKMLRQNLISRQLVKTEVLSSPTFAIEAKVGDIFPNPAVPCLEALGALAADGRRLILVVLNRSLDSFPNATITATVRLNNLLFSPQTATVTKLTSPHLWDHNEESEVVKPSPPVTYAPVPQSFNFEPHSLTIIEFRAATVSGIINLLINSDN